MNPATGFAWDIRSAAVPTVTSGHPEQRSDIGAAGRTSYWTAEFRRRWREARRTTRLQASTIRRLRRVLRHDASVREAISLAAVTYRVDEGMLRRKAWCESGGNPGARNLSSSASGLFQFLPSTFSSTPYGRLSIWSPYASALAAGWMHSVGRGSEWSCK